jgi:bifunctional UDP-N-acetylglucosamine pyrophosphorylase/glucosamine-1-phosphate N-acetyltransferase
MQSALPKVLHRAAGRSLLDWVLAAARAVPCERIVVVVGHGADRLREELAGAHDLDLVVQEEQLGTGHALACVAGAVPPEARLLVLSGDVPLLRPATARRLLEAADRGWGAMAVAELEEPGSLGRVLVDSAGRLRRSVEARDANPEEIALKVVNAGIYALPAADIFDYLGRVLPDNAQGEIYLPDALNLAAADGRAVICSMLEDPREAFGVNTPEELRQVDKVLREREVE